MLKFKSLTAKFCFISIVMLSFLAVYLYADFNFTHHLYKEVEMTNIAGRQRMLVLGISYQVMSMLALPPSLEREMAIKNAKNRMAEYEEALDVLKKGSKEREFKLIPGYRRKPISHIDELKRLWDDVQKPVLLNILSLPPERKNEACGMCHSTIRDNFPKVEALAGYFQDYQKKEAGDFDAFKLSILGFFGIATVFILLFIRRSVIQPVLRLRDAAALIERGKFNVRTEVKTRDEIGALTKTFNDMAKSLDFLFKENIEHLHELSVLNEIAAASNKSLELEDMLKRVLDTLLSLEPLTLERKGAIFLCNGSTRILKLTLSHNFSEEQRKLCSVVPYGECLCGLCAEKGEALITESSADDERHSRTYPDIKDHGHIILPLKSKDKMLGVLCLYLTKGGEPFGKWTELYKSIADIISVSIQNALHYKEFTTLASSLANAQKVAHIGNWDWNIAENTLYWSDEIYRIFGRQPQEFKGTYEAFLNSVHPGDRESVQEAVNEALYKGRPYSIDHRIVLPDGSERVVHEQAEVIFDTEGKPVEMLGTVQDITERKQLEDAFKDSMRSLWKRSKTGR